MKKSFTASTILPLLLAVLVLTGCSRDVRLADAKVRSVTVKAVTHYGEQLNRSASPEKVAYIALRAIKEDFLAESESHREEALDKQFDLCAATELQRTNRTGLSRDEWVHSVVYRWTPTVSHYVGDFPTTWEKAKARLVNRKTETIRNHPTGAKRCEIAMEAADPSGDPNAQVVLLVWLAQDDGFWRVTNLGFDRKHRSLGAKQASTTP